jgi:hypothetical protein
VNPEFAKTNKRHPRPVDPGANPEEAGYQERWITYGLPDYSAKELTVFPGRSVTVRDGAAYGAILTQGYGSINGQAISTPSMIRFGEMTEDEIFVVGVAAEQGVTIKNLSSTEPLVMLKHFAPNNPDANLLLTN